ncbi:hypothetical protein [uncultured Brachyspira sp.]|uniref:hypothetical protein n=1 Tax=uncultured Brachyspira sp. TaxID=221953 RepID=UPI00262C34DF|nr:hypothetical protein [uncultured Brachyspira sp.]
MKKIAFILLFIVFNICSLYSEEYYKINDNSLKILKDAGIEVSEEQKESINMILKKYSRNIKNALNELNDINSKLNNEYKKSDVNINIIKELIFERKKKEADFDYLIISCDLDILELFSDIDIKKIKYYILFSKK